jgi:hypothetical protein
MLRWLTAKDGRTVSMWRAWLAAALLWLTGSSLTWAQAPASSEPLVYRIAFGEVMLGEATVRVQQNSDDYRIMVESRSLGPLDNLLAWTAKAESAGRLAAGAFHPARHDRHTTWRGDVRFIRVQYDGDGSVRIESDPPEEPEKTERILAKAGGAPADPYSAALTLIHGLVNDRQCGQAMQVFDGRRLYRVAIRNGGKRPMRHDRPWAYRGEAVSCLLTSRRLNVDKDDRQGDGDDDDRYEIFVWFGPVGPLGWAPVRVEIPLPLGGITARLVDPGR